MIKTYESETREKMCTLNEEMKCLERENLNLKAALTQAKVRESHLNSTLNNINKVNLDLKSISKSITEKLTNKMSNIEPNQIASVTDKHSSINSSMRSIVKDSSVKFSASAIPKHNKWLN